MSGSIGPSTSLVNPFAGVTDPAKVRDIARDLAEQSWQDLQTLQVPDAAHDPSKRGLYVVRDVKGDPTDAKDPNAVWHLSQVHAAALNLAALHGNYGIVGPIDAQLNGHYLATRPADGPGSDDGTRDVTAYAPVYGHGTDGGQGTRYTDDNTQLGLNYLQAYKQTGNPQDLKRAEDLFTFFEDMMKPSKEHPGEFGIEWIEGKQAFVADSLAGAQKYALILAQNTKDAGLKQRAIDLASKLDSYLEKTLRVHDGPKEDLLLDSAEVDDSTGPKIKAWEDAIFSYNSGWSIGADINWYKLYKDTDPAKAKTYLERAQKTLDATLRYYDEYQDGLKVDGPAKGDGIWRQPPSFNAQFFEDALALEAIAPDPDDPNKVEERLTQYLGEAWQHARHTPSGDPTFYRGKPNPNYDPTHDPTSPQYDREQYEGKIDPNIDPKANRYTAMGSFEGTAKPKTADTIDQAGMVQMYALLAMTPEQRAKLV